MTFKVGQLREVIMNATHVIILQNASRSSRTGGDRTLSLHSVVLTADPNVTKVKLFMTLSVCMQYGHSYFQENVEVEIKSGENTRGGAR